MATKKRLVIIKTCSRASLHKYNLQNAKPCDFQHLSPSTARPINSISTDLALVRLDVRVHDHVSLESLLLDKTLEAHVALVGPYVGMDQDVALHVGQQGELPTADATLVLLHSLIGKVMSSVC